MTAGQFFYRFWFLPLGKIKTCLREGGPGQQLLTNTGRLEMAEAARHLPLFYPQKEAGPFEIHILTGHPFWYQTFFCLRSLSMASDCRVAPVLYNDGSLRKDEIEILLHAFPLGRLVESDEIQERLERYLPSSRFPVLRERRLHYPHIRKLTDVHAGTSGWKLVADSDLLFFHEPRLLLEWLGKPNHPLHAIDNVESYGYSPKLMSGLCGRAIPAKVNVGLCGLDSSSLDWEKIEYWTKSLIEKEGTHYYLEQALVAMLLAGSTTVAAPSHDYVTCPDEREALACNAVMHHYVDLSKRWYFRHNWKRVTGPDQ